MPPATGYLVTGPAKLQFGERGIFNIALLPVGSTFTGAIKLSATLVNTNGPFSAINTLMFNDADADPTLNTGNNEFAWYQYWTAETGVKQIMVTMGSASEPPGIPAFLELHGTNHSTERNAQNYAFSDGGLVDQANVPLQITPRYIELVRPYTYETYQQAGGKAHIYINGWYWGGNPGTLEASWNGGPYSTIWTAVAGADAVTGVIIAAGSNGYELYGALKMSNSFSNVDQNGNFFVNGDYCDITWASGKAINFNVIPNFTDYYGTGQTFSLSPTIVPIGPILPGSGQMPHSGTLVILTNVVHFSGALYNQPVGTGDLIVRWGNDHSKTNTIAKSVAIGNLSTGSTPQAPTLPTTFGTPYSLPVSGKLWNIASGDAAGLQFAFRNCASGDIIKLQSGAQYEAATKAVNNNGSANDITSFRIMPPRSGNPASPWVYVISSDYYNNASGIKSEGNRVDLNQVPRMATIRISEGPNGWPAITSWGAASYYRFVGIDFLTNSPNLESNGAASGGCVNMIQLGTKQASWDSDVYETVNKVGTWGIAVSSVLDLPHHIYFDRCLLRCMNDTEHLQAHILANCNYFALIDSACYGGHSTAESNCVFIWNAYGPFKVQNNYLESLASQIILGANDPRIPGLVPADLEFRNNYCKKPIRFDPNSAWFNPSGDYTLYDIKNHFEIKCAQRVLVDGNIFESCFGRSVGQKSCSIVLTPRNSNGNAPFSVCQDFTFTNNMLDGANIAFHITGPDVHTGWNSAGTLPTQRIRIRNNVFKNLNDYYWVPGDHTSVYNIMFFISTYHRDDGCPIDLDIGHNTMLFGPMVDDIDCQSFVSGIITTALPHHLYEGQKIKFVGTLPTGSDGNTNTFTANTYYFANVINKTQFYLYSAIDTYGAFSYITRDNHPNASGGAIHYSTNSKFSFSGGYTPGNAKLRQRNSNYAVLFDGPFNDPYLPYPNPTPPQVGRNFTFNDNIMENSEIGGGIIFSNAGRGIQQMAAQGVNFTSKGNLWLNLNMTSPVDGGDYRGYTSVGGSVVLSGTNYPISGTVAVSGVRFTGYNIYASGDVNNDNRVDELDLQLINSQLGQTAANLLGDVNNDGTVNSTDYNLANAQLYLPAYYAQDLSLSASSPWKNAASDGTDPGVNWQTFINAIANTYTGVGSGVFLNHAPIGAGRAITIAQSATYTFAASDFGFTDPNDSPSNSLLAVEITTVPTIGQLKNNGVTVSAGQFISLSDINTNKLQYTGTTVGIDSFTFQVQDDGGTLNGGIDTDTTPRNMSFTISSSGNIGSFHYKRTLGYGRIGLRVLKIW